MKRRQFILASVASLVVAQPCFSSSSILDVFKSPTCGCCNAWVEHITRAGFRATTHDLGQDALWKIKEEAGISEDIISCHTGFLDGYFIEGHVPADDVKKLILERPSAHGLAVPGMPIGAPGMEMGNRRDPYDTLLILKDGSQKVFQRHGGKRV
jgi:hypothetical protein